MQKRPAPPEPPPVEPTPPNKRKPWLTLVSYVDELTVGGRRDSQGHYVDGIGNFPGFGRNKTVKVPQDCFPQHCYQRYFFFTTTCKVYCYEGKILFLHLSYYKLNNIKDLLKFIIL